MADVKTAEEWGEIIERNERPGDQVAEDILEQGRSEGDARTKNKLDAEWANELVCQVNKAELRGARAMKTACIDTVKVWDGHIVTCSEAIGELDPTIIVSEMN